MPVHGPDDIRILVVEDNATWRHELQTMFCRILRHRETLTEGGNLECESCIYRSGCFGASPIGEVTRNIHPNIESASNGEEAIGRLEKHRHQFQLLSLDINLGRQQIQAEQATITRLAAHGLDVLDAVVETQRGMAVLVVTGASSDEELPTLFPSESGLMRARGTLAAELNDRIPGASRHFSKADGVPIGNQVRAFESCLPRHKLIEMIEARENADVTPTIPILCLMYCLEDAHFDSKVFADKKKQCVPFDQRAWHYLKDIDIWENDKLDDEEDFTVLAAAAFERVSQFSVILRQKNADAKPFVAPPTKSELRGQKRALKPRHYEFLSRLVKREFGWDDSTQHDTTQNTVKRVATEIRKYLREQFELSQSEDPVPPVDRWYRISIEAFVCSRSYLGLS